ncbi:protein spinster homolog 1-like [Anomaloglossus baeobatrachus]|uniref:protein spinster homolog 1-like n=2 Tax=Anomaloglossus baeobatrachus TaxID=238106 RepID=UPI003F506B45
MALLENSTQGTSLPSHDVEKGADPQEQDLPPRAGISSTRSIISLLILAYINLVTIMASFIGAAILPNMQASFKTDDHITGLISIVFMGSYVLSALVYGYLGDRCNRIWIMCVGMTIWSVVEFYISFIPDENFIQYLVLKALLGAAEASFSTLAPSIIDNLFVEDKRSRMLSIFNVAVPLGCGLGYVIGSTVTNALGGNWHWALRIPPALSILGVLLMIILVKEPSRGAADNRKSFSLKTWLSDMKQISKKRSFIFCTLGTTTVHFTVGAIGFWAPEFLLRARKILEETAPCQTAVCNYHDSMIFGILTVVAGIIGVVAGVEIAKRFKKYNPRADPLVCGFGMLGSAIFLFVAIYLANISLVATYVLIFIGDILLMMNFSIAADIRLYVVSPVRRTTAQAMSMMITHLFGDAISPLIIGGISNLTKRLDLYSTLWSFRSLQYALMACSFVVILGGGFFLLSSFYIEKDREKAEMVDEDCVLEDVIVTSP